MFCNKCHKYTEKKDSKVSYISSRRLLISTAVLYAVVIKVYSLKIKM